MTSHADFEEVLPGTRRLYDENGKPLQGDENVERHGDIVLVPQPTDSPNDPLNWSLVHKIWHSSLVLFIVALTAATSNDAGSAADGVNAEYGISYDVFNTGAGVLFIAIGYWTLLGSPAVHLYGRRQVYLICMIWGVIGSVWFGKVSSPADAIWSQLFVGASESCAEAAVQLSLLDIWFEHQNGTVLGLYTLATAVGTYLGPLIASYISDGPLGWRWIGYFGAIFSGMTFVLFYFGLEETTFHRDRYVINRGDRYLMDGARVPEKTLEHSGEGANTNTNNAGPHINNNHHLDTPSSAEEISTEEKKKAITFDPEKSGSDHEHVQRDRLPSEFERNRMSTSYSRKKTYWQRIRPITPAPNLQGLGFKQYINRLWHMMRVFTFPAVWFAGLQWGMQNVCLTFYLTVEQSTWYDPPWNYSDAAVGNMNVPCLIGSVIGCFYGGYCSDRFMLYMTKRNRGVMESEYRLWLMFLCAAIFPTGMWIFGIGSAKGWSWPAPYVGLGFIGFGYGCAGDLSITYLADSYPDMILEGMVGVAVINNTLAMVFTFVASYWIDSSLQNSFVEVGVISFIVLMLTLPMLIYGKRCRRWTRDRYLKFLEIRDGFEK